MGGRLGGKQTEKEQNIVRKQAESGHILLNFQKYMIRKHVGRKTANGMMPEFALQGWGTILGKKQVEIGEFRKHAAEKTGDGVAYSIDGKQAENEQKIGEISPKIAVFSW